MKGTNEFDGIEGLNQLLETHDKFHELTQIAEPLQTAVQQLNGLGVKAITNSLEAGLQSQLLDAGNLANLNGPLQATSNFAAALEKYHDYIPLTQGPDNIVTAEQMLGTRLDNFIQPPVYATDISSALADLASSAKGVTEDIDFSWMQRQNPWLVEPSILQSIDILGLSEAESSLASLLQAEKETARLSSVASDFPMMTSAATQIASINQMYLSMKDAWRDSVISTEMLGEYYSFAKKQYKDIQKAAFLGDEATVTWRLDVLENTAKFVDRQVAWTTDFAVDVQGELEECETYIPVLENSVDVGKIPQYIGYSKRDKVNVNEAFQKSDFVAITEKGKSIAQKIRVIQEKCSQQPDIDLFKDTNDCFNVCLNLANSFCTKPSELTALVDCIHQLFHQYRDRILAIIGKDSHDCFTFIEDHLKESIYPERGKEITKKQNSLYDNILSLVDDIIAGLDATAPIRTDDKYSEETVCKMIFKALNNIQKNKIYYGKTEDELNDVMRDSLEMVY